MEKDRDDVKTHDAGVTRIMNVTEQSKKKKPPPVIIKCKPATAKAARA